MIEGFDQAIEATNLGKYPLTAGGLTADSFGEATKDFLSQQSSLGGLSCQPPYK